jgi:signal transduction histidine kinase
MGERAHPAAAVSPDEQVLEGLGARLAAGPAADMPALAAARLLSRARSIRSACGGSADADRLAASFLAADVVLELAADGRLDAHGTRAVARHLAELSGQAAEPVELELYTRAVTGPGLLELPPRVAAEICLQLLRHLGAADEATLWRRSMSGVEQLVALGVEAGDEPTRAVAERVIRGSGERVEIDPSLQWATVTRLGVPSAVVVTRGERREGAAAYLTECAAALRPVLEREALLERGAGRERAITQASERRLTRLGFDLHDGPVQEVLALAEDLRKLRDELIPYVEESRQELASGRFDDSLARLVELDRSMREIAHALESRSIVARPLEEVLHREVDRFAERSTITATLEFDGDAQALSASQRIVVYRAVQESLTNIREHSGATEVDLHVRAGRGAVDVVISDNGNGFEVAPALARAAQRGRLGLVGIGERVHMLGGTFEIDSRPGGPTTLRLALPRWEKLEPLPHPGGVG